MLMTCCAFTVPDWKIIRVGTLTQVFWLSSPFVWWIFDLFVKEA